MNIKQIPYFTIDWNTERDEYGKHSFTDIELEADNLTTFHKNIIDKTDTGYSTPRNLVELDAQAYIPKKNDRIYFMKGVTVPRVKLKDLSLNYKIRTTTDIEKATVIVGSSVASDKLVKQEWYYNIPYPIWENVYSELLKIVENLDSYYQERFVNVNLHLKAYAEEHGEDFKILTDWQTQALFNNNSSNKPDNFSLLLTKAWKQYRLKYPNNSKNNSQYVFTISDHNVDFLNSVVGKTIIEQNGLLEVVNGEDCTTINKDMYENLRNMFKSSDSENHILAMEIMANCNYKESVLWLELLYYHHNHEIQYSKSKNHVNFKSLKSYMDKDNYYNQHVDTLIRGLVSHDSLSKEALKIIMEENAHFFNNGGYSEFVKPREYTLNPEVAEKTGFYWTSKTDHYHEKSDVEKILEEDPISEENIKLEENSDSIEETTNEVMETLITKESVNEDTVEEVSNSEADTAKTAVQGNPEIEETEIKTIKKVTQTLIKQTKDEEEFDWF
jgi:hypothetical protein